MVSRFLDLKFVHHATILQPDFTNTAFRCDNWEIQFSHSRTRILLRGESYHEAHLDYYEPVNLVAAAPVSAAQDMNSTPAQATDVLAYRIGGTPIVIPPPTNEMVEMGQDYRVVMDVFVPEQNRLIAAFVLPNDLAIIKSGGKAVPPGTRSWRCCVAESSWI